MLIYCLYNKFYILFSNVYFFLSGKKLYFFKNEKLMVLNVFSKKGFNVQSFGTGDKVKLPGNAPDRPNIYDFGTSYEEIYNDLMLKDKQ